MASLNFYLNRPNATTSGIHFLLNYGAFEFRNGKKVYLPFKYYIDESIDKDNWGKGKAKSKQTFPQHVEFNVKLDRIRNIALSTYRRMENEGIEINETNLRTAFDKELKVAKDFTPNVNTHLIAFAEDFIKNSKNKRDQTLLQYRFSLDNLIEFEEKCNTKFKLLEINMKFYENYIDFLTEKDYAPNTMFGRIKNLKVFLNAAHKRNIPVCTDYLLPEFKKPQEDIYAVYLTEQELLKLYHLDLSHNPALAKVRDLFLIGAYTGLRFSDFSTLLIENIGNDNIIRKRTIKTDQDVAIPVHPIIQSILKRNNNQIPKVSYNLFNPMIKEVVREAKIDYDVSYIETRGGQGTLKVEPKWRRVASHTARRSFATNAYLAGVPVISIMKMTGHKKESSFLKYIKISLTENAVILQKHSFFTSNPDDALQQKSVG